MKREQPARHAAFVDLLERCITQVQADPSGYTENPHLYNLLERSTCGSVAAIDRTSKEKPPMNSDLASRIEAIWRAHPDGAARLAPHQRERSRGQSWMAERLGVRPQTLRGWLSGRRSPRKTVSLLLDRLEQEVSPRL